MHGDPKHPTMNPHPVKRYEIIATADAPGPWDSVKGYLAYQVTNPECTPEDKFLGVHAMPRIVGHDFTMTRVGKNSWKGFFYRDLMQNADYYGLGICVWDPASVSAVFTVHGETFASGSVFEDLTHNVSQTEYFKKSEYLDHSFTGDEALVSSTDNPQVIQQPDKFFPITVTVKEAMP